MDESHQLLALLVLALRLAHSSAQNATTQCQQYAGSCNGCVDYISSEGVTCIFCTSTSLCFPTSTVDQYCAPSDQSHSCSTSYYTIVFVTVICSLFCLCLGTCYLKRFRRPGDDGLLSPLLPEVARNFLWRNSLLAEGEVEWMCIICGFDNKPRNAHCNLCGTTHEFTIEYKSEKKVEKARARLQRRKERVDGGAGAGVAAGIGQGADTVSPVAAPALDVEAPPPALSASSAPPTVDTDPDPDPDPNADIEAADETWRPSDRGQLARLSFSSPSPSLASLSTAQRREAFNYRRLNQLSLRQKSARRRKMWQRAVDGEGNMVWVRAPPQSVTIGEAPFGYTPGHTPANSTQSAGDLWEAARPSHQQQQQASPRGFGFFRSMLGRGGARRGAGGDAGLTTSLLGAGDEDQQDRASDGSRDGSRSPAASRQHSQQHSQQQRTRSDSFGDSVVMSGSPGFTSIFSEDEGGGGWGLRWEKVENGGEARRSSVPGDMLGYAAGAAAGGGRGGSGLRTAVGGGLQTGLANEDLVAVAAWQFKEKQLWFLEQMARLQRPWSDGAVRIEVRRGEHLLDDSARQLADLDRAELHKWMRVQFAGEPGIDAGGLEREWFTLVVAELFSQGTGLFTCSSGDAMGGTYHINPTSGASKLDHLRYFRFAGKVLGKALMEQQVVSATLSLPLRKQMLSLPITFSDLEFVDPQLHRNLKWLDTCPDLAALCLDFTVNYPGAGGSEIFELKEGGAETAVTAANKAEYLLLRLRNRMLDSVKAQLEAMLCGLYEVVPPDLLSVFDYQELELLLCGIPDIDLDDWRRHTEYLSDYARLGARHRVVRWFWQCLEAMSREERVRMLQFTTGCSRLPAQGFKALQSNDGNYRRFNIQAISKKDSLYPRAHTCFNKLDLPLYDSQAELEAYLSVVVNAEITGFTME